MKFDFLEAAAIWGMPADTALTVWTVNFLAQKKEPIPEGSMRVAPGSDAIVWRTCPDYKAEL